MTYKVKEVFYTLQGEGVHAGRPAVFCRFSSCNLWSGHEKDRAQAVCNFCDTDFVGTDGEGGGVFDSPADLAEAISSQWPQYTGSEVQRFVVCTGGEPLLQLDEAVIIALQSRDFEVAVETNGTLQPPSGLDWICVSPKEGAPLVLRHGNELKLVYPQKRLQPECLKELDFEQFFLQPMDGPNLEENTKLALDYCLQHPQWRLSLQTHKFVGIR